MKKLYFDMNSNLRNTNIGQVEKADSVELEVTLLQDVDYSNASFRLLAEKSDNNRVEQKDNYILLEGKITFKLKKEFLSYPGIVKMELNIADKGKEYTTSMFYIRVSDTINSNIIESIEDVETLKELEDYVKNANNTLDNTNVALENLEDINNKIIPVENKRNENELVRTQNEKNRNENERDRITAEKVRKLNEENRTTTEDERIENEETRKNNELNRKTAENLRVSRENAREQAEIQRQNLFEQNESVRNENENTRIKRESKRVAAEVIRESNEDDRILQELDRQKKEDVRETNENARIEAEKRREQQEDNREKHYNNFDEAETARIEAEKIREANENARVTAESNRNNEYEKAEKIRNDSFDLAEKNRTTIYNASELERTNNEEQRVLEESKRDTRETARVEAEKERVTAEELRIEAENARVIAEQERASAEVVREEKINEFGSQVTKIADGEWIENKNVKENQITVLKTNFINEGKNLYNYETNIDGKGLNEYGELYINTNFTTSDFIEVLENTKYTTNNNVNCVFCFYNMNKQYISSQVLVDSVITTPIDCRFVRIALNGIYNKYSLQFEKGDNKTKYEAYKKFLIKSENIEKEDGIFKKGKNLYNYKNAHDGKRFDYETNESQSTSDNIAVDNDTNYVVSGADNGFVVSFWGKNLEPLEEWNYIVNPNSNTFKTPIGCFYIRISLINYTDEIKKKTQLELGTTSTSYEKYYEYEIDCSNVNLKNLKINNSEWKGKKWCVFGDSITEHNFRTAKNYHDYIAENLGMVVQNLGVGGTGYTTNVGSNDRLDWLWRIDQINKDVDLITFMGSPNDYTNLPLGTIYDTGNDTYCGRVNQVIKKALNKFWDKKIAIITPFPRRIWYGAEEKKNYEANKDLSNLYSMSKTLKEIAGLYSIPCLDLYNNSNLYPWNDEFNNKYFKADGEGHEAYPDADGLHPNSLGHEIIATKIQSFIESL